MPISEAGVIDFVYTTDGRAYGVIALYSDGSNPVAGRGVSVQYGTESIVYLITENSDYLLTEDDKRLIAE